MNTDQSSLDVELLGVAHPAGVLLFVVADDVNQLK